jgi:hypothetical protein
MHTLIARPPQAAEHLTAGVCGGRGPVLALTATIAMPIVEGTEPYQDFNNRRKFCVRGESPRRVSTAIERSIQRRLGPLSEEVIILSTRGGSGHRGSISSCDNEVASALGESPDRLPCGPLHRSPRRQLVGRALHDLAGHARRPPTSRRPRPRRHLRSRVRQLMRQEREALLKVTLLLLQVMRRRSQPAHLGP